MRLVTDDDDALRHLADSRAEDGLAQRVVYGHHGRVASPEAVDWTGFSFGLGDGTP